MIYFAAFMIWAWVPIVFVIFSTRPPRDAVIVSFLFAWLFLPTIGFDIPGLPDYTKMTATTLGTLLSIAIFDAGRLFSFRPRWYDLPIVIWCVCPLASAVSSNQGTYDGFSAVIQEVFRWGIPYVVGRLYLNDVEGIGRIARAIAISGLVYIPFCLIEIRLSPVFAPWVYGVGRWEGERGGVFRPQVFLSFGLELGMWMTCASLAMVSLWSSGAVKRLWNIPYGYLTLSLVTVTYMVKATGAFLLFIIGVGIIQLARRTKSSWPAWVLIAVAPFYFYTRLSGIWSGAEIVSLAETYTDADRTQSIRFRFEQEEMMMRSAMRRPIFGHARAGGFNTRPDGGREAISDGYWIITLGYTGMVGMISLWVMLCLPLALAIRRNPPRTWNDPDVAPTVSMAILLALFMVDNLSNAMLNPLYALLMGGIAGQSNGPRSLDASSLWPALARARHLAAEGQPKLAVEEYRKLLDHDPRPEPSRLGAPLSVERAEALEGLAGSLLASGRTGEAIRIFEDLLAGRLAAVDTRDPESLCELARAHESLARALVKGNQHDRAVAERLKAIALWSGLARSDPGLRERQAASLNDLAWLLVVDAPPGMLDATRSAELATEATRVDPSNPACWNTLGVASYRLGRYPESVDALARSIELGPPGGTAFDHYFLAMDSCALGEHDHALAWFEQGVEWTKREKAEHPSLSRFRREAIEVLQAAGLVPPSSRRLA